METEFSLYKGRIVGKFLGPTEESPNRHMYYIGGKRKSGVSTAAGIKFDISGLMGWQGEETARHLFALLESKQPLTHEAIVRAIFAAEEKKQKAADLGTAIHDWCESYIKHRLKLPGHKSMPEMPEDPAVQTGVTSFLEWESEHKVKFLWSEKIVYSKKNDYIGRADFAAVVDGITCLCDIKSSNSLHHAVRLQTAAYALADTEESGQKYGGRWAIRVAKETPSEYDARMALKAKIKTLLGKKTYAPEPYRVFEAKFLDNEKGFMKRDQQAFVKAFDLLKWDKEADFWKEKINNIA